MPAEERQVWLVRHGDTEWSRVGRHSGLTDLSLVASGREQAAAVGRQLAAHQFGLVLTSPLRRAVETAALAGYGEHAQADADLVEWDYGEYDGLTYSEIKARDPGWSLWDSGGPGGETPQDVDSRADRVVEWLRRATTDVLIFSHGHFLRVMASRWMGWPPSAGSHLYLGTAGLGVLGYEHDIPVIRAWNISARGDPA